MKKFKKENVVLQTNDPQKEKDLKLRGFEEIKVNKQEPKKENKKASSK